MPPTSAGTHAAGVRVIATCAAVALLASAETVGAQQQTTPSALSLRPGLVITRSTVVARGTYRLAAPSRDSAVIVIRGNDITVDFSGASLEGGEPNADPDAAAGIAIRIDGGRNVRLLNVRVRGYKVGVLARGTHGLELANIDASHNWKPRLFSLVEHESLVDWLSFHHNEQHEWLRFGAGLYLSEVKGGLIHDNTVEQGMNGLLLAGSDSLQVYDNDFSFNSGLGIGLYRSSDNAIVHNRVDYNVRGYSNGFYRRGQDSADILLYEQSMRNIVAFNSATHGGDGLFLWAGQSTMDTGAGGANDNVFYGNDFSFAPANAMEATFSRNRFIANRLEGSDYGLWGGYSYASEIRGNCFLRNRTGIAIEHGQDNTIVGNRFFGDSTAIRLWADSIQPSDWGYPKHRETRSRGYRISRNVFAGNGTLIQATNTGDLIRDVNDSLRVAPETCPPQRETASEVVRLLPPGMSSIPLRVPTTASSRRDRSAIVVDQWGPYDWRSPKLWPVDSTRAVPLPLAVLGPAGLWSVVERRGISSLSSRSGKVGDTIVVTTRSDSAGDWRLTLEYRNASAPRDGSTSKPIRFSYGRFEPAQRWAVRFFAWSDSTDPRTRAEAFTALVRSTPLMIRESPRLDYEWYRPTIPQLPQANWALEATSAIDLSAGNYTLRTISDDGIRVWIDDRLVIDNWSQHGSEVNYAPVSAGRHHLRVQFFQVDGWTELRVDVLRGTSGSSGSPGPH